MSKEGRIKLLRPLLLALLLGTGAWMAPGIAADYTTAAGKLPNSAVRKMMEDLRASIHHIQLPNGTTIAAETAEERRTPILSLEEARSFVDTGIASARAKSCGLDWKESIFKPMLAAEEAAGSRTPKALAYIAALHGFGMGLMEDTFRKQGCSDETRDAAVQTAARRRDAE